MANLDLIRKYNTRFGKSSPVRDAGDLTNLNEAFDPSRIEKAFSDSIAELGPEYTHYFDFGLPAEVAVLFIDVCSFSTRFANLDGEDIADFFDEYYDIIIPNIYSYGGEIDKIIGDGVVAVFGPPFSRMTTEENIRNADQCARAIIKATANTKFSSKVALHSGTINYFKNKTALYNEFTMIGTPLTELFRLESIAEDDCINYYGGTAVAAYYQSKAKEAPAGGTFSRHIPWRVSSKTISGLKGVAYTSLCYVRYLPNP